MTPLKAPKLILASSSPRRRQLLQEAGYPFDVVEPPIGEPQEETDDLSPTELAEAWAYFKARTVQQNNPDRWVLAADTIVAAGGQILGKPADANQARFMLEHLSDTRHCVISGVALLGKKDKRILSSDTTYITMKPMSTEEIDQYVESGEWVGKAGAYAIQETADRFIENVEGSFTNVVGLPMELVERMICELQERPSAHLIHE